MFLSWPFAEQLVLICLHGRMNYLTGHIKLSGSRIGEFQAFFPFLPHSALASQDKDRDQAVRCSLDLCTASPSFPYLQNESVTYLVNKTTYPILGKYLQRPSRTCLLYMELTVACPKLSSSVALALYCSLLPDYSFRHSELSARGCVRNQLSICWTVRKERRRREEEEKGTRFGG